MFLTPLRRVWLCRGTSVVHRRGRRERLNCSRAVLYTSSSVLRLDGRRVLSGLAPPPLADEGQPSRLGGASRRGSTNARFLYLPDRPLNPAEMLGRGRRFHGRFSVPPDGMTLTP